jgi:hypothetical protein
MNCTKKRPSPKVRRGWVRTNPSRTENAKLGRWFHETGRVDSWLPPSGRRRSIAAIDAPKGPQNGLLQGAKPARLPSVRGRLRFDSLCEATPSFRQVKKPNLVARICDRLCQHEALGTAESTLFGTHRSPLIQEPSNTPKHTLVPERFRPITTSSPEREVQRGPHGSRWTSNSDWEESRMQDDSNEFRRYADEVPSLGGAGPIG